MNCSVVVSTVQALSERGNLSDFQKGQIAGASAAITVQLFGVSRTMVLTIMGTQSVARHQRRRKVSENGK